MVGNITSGKGMFMTTAVMFLASPAKPTVTGPELNQAGLHGCNADKQPPLRGWKREPGRLIIKIQQSKYRIFIFCNSGSYSAKSWIGIFKQIVQRYISKGHLVSGGAGSSTSKGFPNVCVRDSLYLWHPWRTSSQVLASLVPRTP